jgi:SagB-type dehydrogenase family enzyme
MTRSEEDGVRSGTGGSMLVLAALLSVGCVGPGPSDLRTDPPSPGVRLLPVPERDGSTSVEAAIEARRSVRDLDPRPLTDAQVGQLLWSAQGVTDPAGLRAAPSAGATYPLELYAVTPDGVARYVPTDHGLLDHLAGDHRAEVAATTRGQAWVADAPLVVVVTGVEARTAERYGDRAHRYLLLEAGHAAQNLLLQATAMGLVGTPVGAFDDDALARALLLPDAEVPLYLLPIGVPAETR